MDSISSEKKIRSLSKKWFPAVKKAGSNSLIKEVYSLMYKNNDNNKQQQQQQRQQHTNTIVLDILLETSYFNNILWANFDRDVPSSHIESILLLCIHDANRSWKNRRTDVIATSIVKDAKFEQLIIRLLEMTSQSGKHSDYRLYSFVMRFFSIIVSEHYIEASATIAPLFDIFIWSHRKEDVNEIFEGDPDFKVQFEERLNYVDSLTDKKEQVDFSIKSNWINNLIVSTSQEILVTAEDTLPGSTLDYTMELVNFLSIVVSLPQVQPYFKKYIELLHFDSIIGGSIRSKRHLQSLKPLQEKLLYFIQISNPVESTTNISELHSIIYNINKKEFSVNAGREEIEEFLYSCDDLISISRQIDPTLFADLALKLAPSNLSQKDILIQIISSRLFSPIYNRKYTIEDRLYKLSERDLIDNFETISPTDSILSLYSPSSFMFANGPSTISDYESRTIIDLQRNLEVLLHEHVTRVLSRLNIDSNLNIKGKSKYFHKVDSLEVVNSQIMLETKTPFLGSRSIVLLVELIKPNKYSEYGRIREYGLNLLRTAKFIEVTPRSTFDNNKQKASSVVSVSCPEKIEAIEDRIKYFITVPSNKVLMALLSLIEDPLSCLNTSRQASQRNNLLDVSLKILEEPITTEEISERYSQSNKKRKLAAENEENSNGIVTFSGEPLNEFQNHVLVGAINHKLTIVEYVPGSGIKQLIPSLLDNFMGERTLVIVPTTSYLDIFPSSIGEKSNTSYVKYNSQSELKQLFDLLKTKTKRISSMFEDVESSTENGLVSLNMLAFFEAKLRYQWKKYLNRVVEEKDKSAIHEAYSLLGGVNNLDKTATASFQVVSQLYCQVLEDISFLRSIQQILSKTGDDTEIFQFLLNNFNTVITYDDYLNLHFGHAKRHRSFDNILIVNGTSESIVVVKDKTPSLKRLVVFGGQVAFNLRHLEHLTPSIIYDIRNVFCSKEDKNSAESTATKVPLFNPGLKYHLQQIQVDNHIVEAEYSVLLYQYMRLLGYPRSKICIWVSTLLQKVLVEEILSKRCTITVKDSKWAQESFDDDNKFQFGWPHVIFNSDGEHDYDTFDYSIISTYNTDARTLISKFPGRFGNYILGKDVLIDRKYKLPKSHDLQIIVGENYATTTRAHDREYTIEGKDHFEQYIYEMTQVRLRGAKT
ncbi:uncharacterized protein RJT20DRAFT_124025 [Scheffersomyces xylosifermentans]|uniref:uncharacterized protein n=1 Tax=Scheffersomyces xylosifermentans TaxID=1304137 RepID=UPI00315DFA36